MTPENKKNLAFLLESSSTGQKQDKINIDKYIIHFIVPYNTQKQSILTTTTAIRR